VSCPRMQSLGVYVVGAIYDDERALLDLHVADCPDCRRELERLMPLPRYLAHLTAEEFERIQIDRPPPAGLLTRLRAAVSAERRRLARTRVAAVAALALTLIAAAAAVELASRPEEAPAPAARVAAVDPASGVRAAVTLTPRAWGTALTVQMDGAAPGERCRLVVRARDGSSDVAATWRATYRGSAGASGSTELARADVAAIDVVTTAGRRLVHVPVPPFDPTTAQEEAS
jgi:hypothetical protein